MQWDEVNTIGTVNFNGCTPLGNTGDIEIRVAEAWDDEAPDRCILLFCEGAAHGTEYRLDLDKAEALARLLLSAATGMRRMIRHLEESEDETDEMFEHGTGAGDD